MSRRSACVAMRHSSYQMIELIHVLVFPGVSVSASVFTLMVLSVDRFLAIRHPMTFRSYSTSRYAICILTCLWILATSIMIPLVLVRQIHTIQLTHHVEPLHVCTEIWKHAYGRRIYDCLLFVFMFVMPGCFITASYSLIGCKLWTEKQQIHRRDSQAGREQTEKVMSGRRRVARMLAALAVVFACCWLPYHIHSLYLDFSKLQDVTAAVEALPFTILLGHANSSFNPILYCFMNKSFRKATARLLHIKTKRKKRTSKRDPVSTQARIQGGGQGCLAPPPPFSGEKTMGPKTTHTEEKKIKIGQPRSKIQAKTYHKTH